MTRLSYAVITGAALQTVFVSAIAGSLNASEQNPDPSKIIEIRAYTLKAGTRERFHQLFVSESLPMLRRWRVDVVAYGPSLHDAMSYYLVRSFANLEGRTRSEEAFYSSKEWTEGPRDAVLADIESYSTVVVRVDEQTLASLRRLNPQGQREDRQQGAVMPDTVLATSAAASDVAILLALNDDYIRSVERSDAKRFQELLADDFLCSLPDGSHIDRNAFLHHAGAPAEISNLQAHDVNVRVMGDFALVHARTTFTRDGRPGAGRYTDAWARRDGHWVAIAAHVTRY